MSWQRDPEKKRACSKRYYERHREKVKAKALAYQAANKDRHHRWDPAQSEAAGFDPVMSYEEIGAELGISKARVGQLIESALRKLRARFPQLRELFR